MKFCFLWAVSISHAVPLSSGQKVYVPAYSHNIGNRGTPYLLAITLSIRNIDPSCPVWITTVDYYETQGEFLKKYITDPIVLQPLASTRYVVKSSDKKGGSGANFIVE